MFSSKRSGYPPNGREHLAGKDMESSLSSIYGWVGIPESAIATTDKEYRETTERAERADTPLHLWYPPVP
jgi:hypothetical protein